MSAERVLPSGMAAAFQARVIKLLILIDADFPAGITRIWSGLGTREFSGETYRGVGALLSIPAVKERTDGGLDEVTVSLSGLDSNIFDPTILGDYQGRSFSIRLGVLTGDEETLVGPLTLFKGVMDADSVAESGGESVVTMIARSSDSDKAKRRPWLYSQEDQNELHAGDKGLSRMTEIQGRGLEW